MSGGEPGGPGATCPPGPSVEQLRRRLIERIEVLEGTEELQILELIAYLNDYPYSAEMAVEVMVSVTAYVDFCRAIDEQQRSERPDSPKEGVPRWKN